MHSSFYLSYLLIAANAIVFIAETVSGGSTDSRTAIRFGAQTTALVKEGQWYRLFTSMFVHFGYLHIVCNMYALYSLGPTVENLYNPWIFLLIYLGSGLCGNLLTMTAELRTGRYAVSAGASGAIFGLFGTFLALLVFPETRGIINARSVFSTLAVNLVYSIVNRRINLWAHLGGLAAGTVLTLIVTAGILYL